MLETSSIWHEVLHVFVTRFCYIFLSCRLQNARREGNGLIIDSDHESPTKAKRYIPDSEYSHCISLSESGQRRGEEGIEGKERGVERKKGLKGGEDNHCCTYKYPCPRRACGIHGSCCY